MAFDSQWAKEIAEMADEADKLEKSGFVAALKKASDELKHVVVPLLADVQKSLTGRVQSQLAVDSEAVTPGVTFSIGGVTLRAWAGVERVKDELFPTVYIEVPNIKPVDVYAAGAVPTTKLRAQEIIRDFVLVAVEAQTQQGAVDEERGHLERLIKDIQK